jgi:hypothetical protein
MKTVENIVGKLGTFRELDLNDESLNTFFASAPNPLTDKVFCGHWVEHLHRKHGVDYSYGGYLEDRSHLWRQTYLQPNAAIHLGIDINVPSGSLVFCPIPFKVLKVEYDLDQNGGWGTKVTIKTEYGCVIYAHLYRGVMVTVGHEYDANSCIGAVGPMDDNGGWFPHLHLQGVSEGLSSTIIYDGYAHRYPRMELDYPHPFPLLGIDIA